MPLSPQTARLLEKAVTIERSEVGLIRVLELLSGEQADIAEVVGRFGDVGNRELRRSFKACAQLLRHLEEEAVRDARPAPAAGGAQAVGGDGKAGPKRRYDTTVFVRVEMRGQVPEARLFTDGASRGNPGPAGIGWVLQAADGTIVAQHSESIGLATNNVAEYRALISGLETAVDFGVKALEVVGDSELVIKQMSGVYAVKHPDMKPLAFRAQALARQIGRVAWRHVPRDQNAHADALSTASIPKGGAKG